MPTHRPSLLRRAALALCATMLATGLVAPAAAPAQTPASLPVGHCINFGAMLDSDNWGNKTLDASDFVRVKAVGFDTVRLTTNWANHAATTAPYTIRSGWVNVVKADVEAGLAAGLNIIIDYHNFNDLMASPAANKARLAAQWGQIASIFADKPDAHLWFELVNEPNTNLTNTNLLDTINPALQAIRAVSPTRPVIIGGGDWSSVRSLATLQLPDDPNVWPTFHYYDPMDFTHQGASWVNPVPPVGRVYGTYWDQVELADGVQRVKDFIARTGKVPFIGETGVWVTVPTDQRAGYHATVYNAFSPLGVAQCPWAYTNTFHFYDYTTGKWLPGMLESIGLTTPAQ